MAKRKDSKTTGHATKREGPGPTQRPQSAMRILGAVCLILCVLMSLLLVLDHFGGLSLPGCGEGGPCEQAADSFWGKIRLGGFEWPVSFLGLAYFLAALFAWIASGDGVSRAFRYLVRAGALVSAGFTLIIFMERTFCAYCVGAHLGNFAFWATMEWTRNRSLRSRFAMTAVGATFVAITLALGVADSRYRQGVREEAESERAATAQSIIDQSQQDPIAEVSAEPGDEVEITSVPAPPEPVSFEEPAPQAPPEPTGPAFTGRHRIGPEKAPIRIVVFTDYQCRDCYSVETQLRRLRDSRSDLSISIKHFPFNSECNPHISRTLHPNACWAARAAEAAGILWGPEAFWQVHVWLFEKRGVFQNTQELEVAIREMGYDPTGFTSVMRGNETLEAIRADAEEGKKLGLFFTPMIFINGIELKGWSAPDALIRTVEEVAATNPPARSPSHDRPSLAFQKYIDDWRDQPKLTLPGDTREWSRGAEAPRVDIVMWGDYQEPGTGEADAIIRRLLDESSDVRYSYRHFPFNSDCNPKLNDRRHPNACRAALAAEAAGRIGGDAAFWKMHDWLMENRDRFSDEILRQAANGMGLDTERLFTLMADLELKTNILADVRTGGQLPRLRHGMPAGVYGVPAIFVNGRFIPRWKLDDRPILREILEGALRDS